jgi:DNA-binding MarR family transcriptional regulator
LIERSKCDHDRRVVYIHISENGLKLLDQIEVSTDIQFMNNLSEEEAAVLSGLLDKIR